VIRKISAEILATVPCQQLLEDGTLILTEADIKEFVHKAFRERDTSWLTNGRAALHLLAGYYIRDENGTCYWVLLAQRLITIYKDSDWRVERLSAFIVWMNSPAVIWTVDGGRSCTVI
jgi:hypothetical protein